MTQREMFEKSFQRPKNYFNLSPREQWNIDAQLGILDWTGENLSSTDLDRVKTYYDAPRNSR